MNDRTGNGHWALGIHTEPRRPQHGDFGKGKVRARVVQAAAGLVLCRIRRADKEVSCISCPYWRLLLPVKGLPHLSRLPFHGTLHRLRSHSSVCHFCPQHGGNLRIVRHTVRCLFYGTCPGTQNKHAPGWAEQSERTPRLGSREEARMPCPGCPAQVDTLDGAGAMGLWVWASMQLLNNKTHAIAVQGSIHPPNPGHQGTQGSLPVAGQMSEVSPDQLEVGGAHGMNCQPRRGP